MAVILRAKLPKGDTNGLARLATQVADDQEPVYVVMRLDALKVITNLDDDSDPTSVLMGIAHVEVADPDQAMMLLDLLNNAYAARTGKRELPWDEIPSGNETGLDEEGPPA